MLGSRLLRLFERGTGPGPVDCVGKDDGHALTAEEVDRIARSLIEGTPLDDNRQRESRIARDAKLRLSGNDRRR
jgi:hypothetical protein